MNIKIGGILNYCMMDPIIKVNEYEIYSITVLIKKGYKQFTPKNIFQFMLI